MADINNSIRIAKDFIMKWEKCFSASPNSNVSISKNADPSTKVYAYYDTIGKVWTIGWGNTYNLDGSRVREGQVITKKEADDLIDGIIRQIESSIRSSIPYQNLNDNEYASIISITYNAGKGNLLASRIPDALNSNKSKQEIASIIQDSIVTSKGKFVQGLKNRRIDESKLFLGEYNKIYNYIGRVYRDNKKTINYTLFGIVLIGITTLSYWYYKKNN